MVIISNTSAGGGKVTERPGDQSGLEQKDLDIIGNFLAKKQTLDLEYIINCKKGMDNEKALAIWKEKLGEMHQESHDKFKSTGSSIKPLSELKRKPED